MLYVILVCKYKETFWQHLNQLKIHMQIIYEYQNAFLMFGKCGLISLLFRVLSKPQYNCCESKIQARLTFPQHITESFRHIKFW
jgi:hypothetical protein